MSIIALQPWITGALGGYSDRIDPGTPGVGRPGGIENILEFNGAYLNNRHWKDTILVTSIEGLGDADIRDARDVNPDDHGETAFDAFYSGRTIVLTGKLRAFTIHKLRTMQMGLRQIFADLTERPLIFRTSVTDADVQIYCRKSAPIAMTETQGNYELTRDFQVTLRASNPRFTTVRQYNAISSALGNTTTATLFTATNQGNFDASPTIIINGPITMGGAGIGLNLYSYSGGVLNNQILINTSLASGHYLVIDTFRRTIKEYLTDGTFVANRYEVIDPTSIWFSMPPGDTVVEAQTYNTGGGTVEFRWNYTYM